MAEPEQALSSVGLGRELCTWWPVPVENMNIHKILQIVLQCFPRLPTPPVCALDAFGLPVCPVDSLTIKSKSKGVRQIAPNQHLLRLPPSPEEKYYIIQIKIYFKKYIYISDYEVTKEKRLCLLPLNIVTYNHSTRRMMRQS